MSDYQLYILHPSNQFEVIDDPVWDWIGLYAPGVFRGSIGRAWPNLGWREAVVMGKRKWIAVVWGDSIFPVFDKDLDDMPRIDGQWMVDLVSDSFSRAREEASARAAVDAARFRLGPLAWLMVPPSAIGGLFVLLVFLRVVL